MITGPLSRNYAPASRTFAPPQDGLTMSHKKGASVKLAPIKASRLRMFSPPKPAANPLMIISPLQNSALVSPRHAKLGVIKPQHQRNKSTYSTTQSTVQSTPTASSCAVARGNLTLPGTDLHNKLIVEKFGLAEVWEEVFGAYKLIDKKGQGSYGCVMRAACKTTGQEVAIKMIKNFKKYEYELVKVIREIKIMKALTKMSPKSMTFFPQLLDIIIPSGATVDTFDTLFIVMDHVETDLSKVIKSGRSCQLDKSHVRNILYNLLCALHYLSSANILHRDVKPGNILMNKYCQVRICDFGLARTLPRGATGQNTFSPQILRNNVIERQIHLTAQSTTRSRIVKKVLATQKERTQRKRALSSHVGSRWYRAPEIILVEKSYDHSIDTWSVGVILYELAKLSQRAQTEDQNDRRLTMFQGHFCYPLTPPRADAKPHEIDQISCIINKLGVLSDDDKSFISNEEAKTYCSLQRGDKQERQKFLDGVAQEDQHLQELLSMMVEFNPFLRASPAECLKNPYFDPIRVPQLELPAPEKIYLEIDQEDACDYQSGASMKFTKQECLKMIFDEVVEMKQSRRTLNIGHS